MNYSYLSCYQLCYRIFHPLPDTDQDHAEKEGEGMKYQLWYHTAECLKTFLLVGDRHDNIDRSADATEEKKTAQYI